jgi:hypothetical protein
MSSGKNFTYLLYALLGGLILAAGYAVLEQRKKRDQQAAELARDAQLLDSIDRMGAIDTSTAPKSTYTDVKPTTSTTTTPTAAPKVTKDGIETDAPAAKPTAPATKPVAPVAKTTPTTTSSGAPAKLVPKAPTTTKKGLAPTTSGKYLVKVGVFSQVENARAEMERFVKMGYLDAEVVKYQGDKWCVAAKRTGDKALADRIKGDLDRRGVDSQVITIK